MNGPLPPPVVVPPRDGTAATLSVKVGRPSRPILLLIISVNHSAPSGPGVMKNGSPLVGGSGDSEITPAVVIRPILLPFYSVNQIAPSGPAVMPSAMAVAVGIANSVNTPAVVICPILLPTPSRTTV